MSNPIFPQADQDAIAAAVAPLWPDQAAWIYQFMMEDAGAGEAPVARGADPVLSEVAHGALTDHLLMLAGFSSLDDALVELAAAVAAEHAAVTAAAA